MTDPETRAEIMAATYGALCERGYTELTAQDIADRTDKSKSLLFYHYGSKGELLAEFVTYLIEAFEDRIEANRHRPPLERLAAFVDWFLHEPDGETHSFHTALLELRAQAPYTDRYREPLREADDHVRTALERILREGVEAGSLREHDSTEVATLLIAALDGARVRHLTLDRAAYLETVRTATVERIISDLLAPETEFPDGPIADAGEPFDPTDGRPEAAPLNDGSVE